MVIVFIVKGKAKRLEESWVESWLWTQGSRMWLSLRPAGCSHTFSHPVMMAFLASEEPDVNTLLAWLDGGGVHMRTPTCNVQTAWQQTPL